MNTNVDRIQGLSGSLAVKAPCRVATTAAITLSGLQAVDGVTVSAGDRVLVKNQADTSANGIYNADTGDWTRALDFNAANDAVLGTLITVREGTTNGTAAFKVTALGTIGTDSTAFANVAWITGTSAGGATVTRFSGDAATTTFALNPPGGENDTLVFVSGVYQQKDTYALVGSDIVFSEAPVTGTNNIEIVT